jgi:REP element-mobilizing transposase RayT
MARSVRIEYAGAIYHVMCRGDRREAIFRDDQDREMFLATLAQMCGRTGHRVHGYVFMSNHYHLLLETPAPNLVAGMKWFQGTYTQRHNARHRLCGHLFQGRYKAIPVDADSPGYFAAASEYIHLNPARAGLLDAKKPDLLDYRWSSYPIFVRQARLPGWLRRERVFGSVDLKDEQAGSRRRYREWMAARTRDVLEQPATAQQAERWRKLRRGWYLGSETFGDRLMDWASGITAGRKRGSYRPSESLRAHDEGEARRLLAAGLRQLELTLAEAVELRKSDPRKQALAWLMKSRTVMSAEWIIRRLAMGHRSDVSRAVSASRTPKGAQCRKLQKLLHICTD